jgi:putative membrane protein insertion efficiency factor
LKPLRPIRRGKVIWLSFSVLALIWTLSVPFIACGSEVEMKGPRARPQLLWAKEELETSSVRLAFLQSIRFYQKFLSPFRSEPCGFSPSCSRYGSAAIEEQGPLVGILMTADRLMRCHIWKRPGPDYLLLPTGKLYDPVSINLLPER